MEKLADIGEDYVGEEATAQRAIEKLHTGTSSGIGFLIVLMIINIPSVFLVGFIVFSVRRKNRYKNIDKTKEAFDAGPMKSDVSGFVVVSNILMTSIFVIILFVCLGYSSKIRNYTHDEIYEIYNAKVQRESDSALNLLINSGGSNNTSANTIAEYIPYEQFTEEEAGLFMKPRYTFITLMIIGNLILIAYIIINLIMYLRYSKAPEKILEIRQRCLGRSGKFGDVIKIMIQCSWSQKLPTYYNVIKTYQNGGLVSTRKEHDAGMNILTWATFKVMIPVIIVYLGAAISTYWAVFLALESKYRHFDRPDLEYRYWEKRMNNPVN